MDINFSFTDIFEYWDIFKEYINPFTIITWAIGGGILGFVLVIILEIVFRKRILVKRRHWSLKILSYIYLAFLPLFAGFCFTEWFGFHACERELVKNMPTYMGSTNQLYNEYLKDIVEESVEAKFLELTGNEFVDKGLTYATDIVKTALESDMVDNTTSEIVEAGVIVSLAKSDYLKGKIKGAVEDYIDETILIEKGMTRDILNLKVQNILDDGVFNSIVEKYIRNIFGGLKSKAILTFLLGISIPLIEIIIANILEKKRLASLN